MGLMLVKVPFPLLPEILDGRILPWDGGASKRRWRVLSSPLVLRLSSNLISFDGQHDNGRFTGEQLAIMLVEIAFAFLGALSSASLYSRSPWQFRIRKDMACKSWNGASLAFPCLLIFLWDEIASANCRTYSHSRAIVVLHAAAPSQELTHQTDCRRFRYS